MLTHNWTQKIPTIVKSLPPCTPLSLPMYHSLTMIMYGFNPYIGSKTQLKGLSMGGQLCQEYYCGWGGHGYTCEGHTEVPGALLWEGLDNMGDSEKGCLI